MAKGSRGRRRIASRQCRPNPYPLFSDDEKKIQKVVEKKDWEGATCPVCIEYPHNAVLLLCSSHDNGCRPYMCGTSCRHSNCLDQYKKAYTKVNSSEASQLEASELEESQLACPLCRGQVKGWTVVEPAREFLNLKKRTCMENDCTFVGSFKDLKKHVKSEHPSSRPRKVDPVEEQKWSRLERERERNDVISTIRSSMPGAMVLGDYVIEGSHIGINSDEDEDEGFDGERSGSLMGSNLVNVFLLLQAFDSAAANARPQPLAGFGGGQISFDSSDSDDDDDDDDDEGGSGGDVSLVGRFGREGRILLGRSGRGRYRGDNNGGEN